MSKPQVTTETPNEANFFKYAEFLMIEGKKWLVSYLIKECKSRYNKTWEEVNRNSDSFKKQMKLTQDQKNTYSEPLNKWDLSLLVHVLMFSDLQDTKKLDSLKTLLTKRNTLYGHVNDFNIIESQMEQQMGELWTIFKEFGVQRNDFNKKKSAITKKIYQQKELLETIVDFQKNQIQEYKQLAGDITILREQSDKKTFFEQIYAGTSGLFSIKILLQIQFGDREVDGFMNSVVDDVFMLKNMLNKLSISLPPDLDTFLLQRIYPKDDFWYHNLLLVCDMMDLSKFFEFAKILVRSNDFNSPFLDFKLKDDTKVDPDLKSLINNHEINKKKVLQQEIIMFSRLGEFFDFLSQHIPLKKNSFQNSAQNSQFELKSLKKQ
jgi:hypothetical protein